MTANFESTNDRESMTSVRRAGLKPNTANGYNVKDESLDGGQFTTTPAGLSEEAFCIAFGADFHKIGMYRPELIGSPVSGVLEPCC